MKKNVTCQDEEQSNHFIKYPDIREDGASSQIKPPTSRREKLNFFSEPALLPLPLCF